MQHFIYSAQGDNTIRSYSSVNKGAMRPASLCEWCLLPAPTVCLLACPVQQATLPDLVADRGNQTPWVRHT